MLVGRVEGNPGGNGDAARLGIKLEASYELGLLAAAGTLTIIPGAFVIYFVRHYIAKGFALGRV